MSFDIHLTISDLIGVGGILTTIASVLWAVYEKRQTRSARAETARFRQLLIQQQVAE